MSTATDFIVICWEDIYKDMWFEVTLSSYDIGDERIFMMILEVIN